MVRSRIPALQEITGGAQRDDRERTEIIIMRSPGEHRRNTQAAQREHTESTAMAQRANKDR